jgi:von Willebrand factor type A domain
MHTKQTVEDWNLDNNQVLVVAGDWAFHIAEKYGIYECQNKRTFRSSRYMAFYKDGGIDTLFEIIQKPYDNGTVENTPVMSDIKKETSTYDEVSPRRVIQLKKIKSIGPIKNDGKSKTGKTVPFTYGQARYTTFDWITRAKLTSELVHGVKGIEIIDTIVVPKKDNAKADIIFVIDNSGSMGDHQKNLSENVDKFITTLVNERDIPDFKIGICTTDSSNLKVLSREDMRSNIANFINSLKSSMLVGTSGSATEKGLEMALNAVRSGFSRMDSLLFVNIISDENDDSSASPDYYVEQMKQVKGGKKVIINAVYNSSSAKHFQAALLTNGITADIKSNYGELLSDIGKNVSDLVKTVPLSEIPNDLLKISVQRNKQSVNDWKHNSKLNSIDFSVPLAENDVVDVIYFVDED